MADLNTTIDSFMDTHPACLYFAPQTMKCPECGERDGLLHTTVEVAARGVHIHLTCSYCKKGSILVIRLDGALSYDFLDVAALREEIANGWLANCI
jgi:hypothetical protein